VNKLLVIGLDGADWKTLRSWIDKGQLPFFKQLMGHGVYGPLESTIPCVTAPAWVSFSTGKNQGRHGVYGFLDNLRQGEESHVINALSIPGERIWHILDRAGKHSCVINLPTTYPPTKINGIMVSCFLTPSGAKDYFWPPEVGELLQRLGYKIDLEFERLGWVSDSSEMMKNRQAIYSEQLDITEKRYQLGRELIRRQPWDFFFLHFKGTDTIQHLFWDDAKQVLDYFKFIEAKVKALIEEFSEQNHGETVCFIMSDHGFHEAATQYFCVYPWLRRHGYLPPLIETKPVVNRIGKHINRFSKFLGLDLRNTRWALRQYKERVRKGSNNLPFDGCHIGIFINHYASSNRLEYEELRDSMIQKLRSLNDSQGQPVLMEVCRREEVFSGENLTHAPDIVFLPHPQFAIQPDPLAKNVFETREHYLPGNHWSARQGIFIAHGKGVESGKEIAGVRLIDLVPTFLHILGVPIPRDVDGIVLKELFRFDNPLRKQRITYQDPFKQNPDLRSLPNYSAHEKDEQDVKSRLKALGYLD